MRESIVTVRCYGRIPFKYRPEQTYKCSKSLSGSSHFVVGTTLRLLGWDENEKTGLALCKECKEQGRTTDLAKGDTSR